MGAFLTAWTNPRHSPLSFTAVTYLIRARTGCCMSVGLHSCWKSFSGRVTKKENLVCPILHYVTETTLLWLRVKLVGFFLVCSPQYIFSLINIITTIIRFWTAKCSFRCMFVYMKILSGKIFAFRLHWLHRWSKSWGLWWPAWQGGITFCPTFHAHHCWGTPQWWVIWYNTYLSNNFYCHRYLSYLTFLPWFLSCRWYQYWIEFMKFCLSL